MSLIYLRLVLMVLLLTSASCKPVIQTPSYLIARGFFLCAAIQYAIRLSNPLWPFEADRCGSLRKVPPHAQLRGAGSEDIDAVADNKLHVVTIGFIVAVCRPEERREQGKGEAFRHAVRHLIASGKIERHHVPVVLSRRTSFTDIANHVPAVGSGTAQG